MRLVHRLQSVAELGSAFRRGATSPLQVTEQLLERIASTDDQLNAFISVWPESARAAARQAEAELQAGTDRGPLHGVPVALKDNIEVSGHTATYGSKVVLPDREPDDAWVTTALKRAGAVILGKTNMLEFAYGIVNEAYGQTNNPWDPRCTAGGSSGGSAAAVAAGLVHVALGSDTGGSIRVPAAYCGVAGLKPTFGSLPVAGVFPLSGSLDHVGPLAQTCADLALVWSVLSGEEPVEARCNGSLRIGVLAQFMTGSDMAAEVAAALQLAVQAFAAAGVQFEEVRCDLLDNCNQHLGALVSPEASLIHERFVDEQADNYAQLTRRQLLQGYRVSAVDYLRAQRYRQELQAAVDQLLSGYDALLLPAAPWTAPAADPAPDGPEGEAEGRRTAPFNLTGHPVVAFPAGLAAGCPVGLQLVGARGQDSELLAAAQALERVAPPVWS